MKNLMILVGLLALGRASQSGRHDHGRWYFGGAQQRNCLRTLPASALRLFHQPR